MNKKNKTAQIKKKTIQYNANGNEIISGVTMKIILFFADTSS